MITNNYFGQVCDKSLEGLSVTQVLRPMPVCHFKTLQTKHVWSIPNICHNHITTGALCEKNADMTLHTKHIWGIFGEDVLKLSSLIRCASIS